MDESGQTTISPTPTHHRYPKPVPRLSEYDQRIQRATMPRSRVYANYNNALCIEATNAPYAFRCDSRPTYNYPDTFLAASEA